MYYKNILNMNAMAPSDLSRLPEQLLRNILYY